MMRQCWAIIALKWTILTHTFSSGKLLGTLVGALLALMVLSLAVAGSTGAFMGAWRLLGSDDVDNLTLLAIFDGAVFAFLFLLLLGLLMDIQRADIIDLRKMLHFPVSLPMVFSMNFIASLFGPAFLLATPISLAFIAGMVLSRGPNMLLCIPLALAFILMVMAWAYHARGLFAMLMENKRRCRIIMGLLPFALFLLLYSPAWVGAAYRATLPYLPPRVQQIDPKVLLTAVSAMLPPLWFPCGVTAIDRGDHATALAAFAGLIALMAVGLWRGYRAMHDYCLGCNRVERSMDRPTVGLGGRPAFTAGGLPFLAEDTAALTRAAWLHYVRLPNLRTVVGANLLMPIAICFMVGISRKGEGLSPFLVGLVILSPYMSLSAFLLNFFGADYDGFRCHLLAPTPRHKVLLARNLALAPIAGGVSLTPLVLLGFLAPIPWTDMLTWLFLAPVVYICLICFGNYTSSVMPYALPRSALKRNKLNTNMLLAALVNGLVFMVPVWVCAIVITVNWVGRTLDMGLLPLGPVAALALLAGMLFAYPYLLRSAGALLRRREQRILEMLTRDHE